MASSHHGTLIHVVFGTKQRFKLAKAQWREELFAFIGCVAREHQAIVLKSGGVEDHIHLLIKIHPAYAISETIKLIKSNSSRWINEQRKIGNARFSWQRGYGAFSVSESNSDAVKRYIANQEEHHRRQTFAEEYIALLARHRLEFDRRYIFDEEIVAS